MCSLGGVPCTLQFPVPPHCNRWAADALRKDKGLGAKLIFIEVIVNKSEIIEANIRAKRRALDQGKVIQTRCLVCRVHVPSVGVPRPAPHMDIHIHMDTHGDVHLHVARARAHMHV